MKENLDKQDYMTAISFLKSLDEDNFVRREQTLKFDPIYIGEKHCVAGHLYVNPASPFYSPEDLSDNKTRLQFMGMPFNRLGNHRVLTAVNNNAPADQIKDTVITALIEEMNYRFE